MSEPVKPAHRDEVGARSYGIDKPRECLMKPGETDWTGLAAFEAAGRLGSFSSAASELGISQSAISQRVRRLEENVGARLFVRRGRGVALTEIGSALWRDIGAGFQRIEFGLTAAGTRKPRGDAVNLAVWNTFATYRLLPLIVDFRDKNPDIDIRVMIIDRPNEELLNEADLWVQRGDGHWPGYESWEIAPEWVFPVCSPGYLETHGEIREVADLRHHKLIYLTDRHFPRVTWTDWFEKIGHPPLLPASKFQISNYSLVIEAAKMGAGLVLGWEPLVDDLITQRALVAPALPRLSTGKSYWLVRRDRSPRRPAAELLKTWLLSQLRRSQV